MSGASAGLILGLIGALALAGAAVATPLVPALKAALGRPPEAARPRPRTARAPTPATATPARSSSPRATATATRAASSSPSPASPTGGPARPGRRPAAGGPQGATPAAGGPADFAPFWFAVPVARPLYGEDGSPQPIAELAPGTWYLAVEQRGQALIAQTQDGRRGVLQDTTGIQRG